MIQRTEQQRNVGRSSRDERHVARVALHHVGGRLTLQEHLYVAAHQLHGLHLIALGHKCRSIAPRPRTDVEQEGVLAEEPVQMVHGGFKFYYAVSALQAQVFGMLVVMLLYVGQCHIRSYF